MNKEKITYLILVFLVFIMQFTSVWARRVKGDEESRVRIMFVPEVEDPERFWMADIVLFTVIADILGKDADENLVKEWIEFQQQKAQETFEIIISLLDILTQVEEKDVRNGFLIEDLNGEIVNGIVNYFKTVCEFLGLSSESGLGHIFVNEILNGFFTYSLKPESKALTETMYEKIFSSQ